jgi:hypothetical protein
MASARLVSDAAIRLALLKSVAWVGCRSARSSPVAAASPVKSLTSKSTSAPTSPAKGQASPGHIVDVKTVADEGVSLKGVELEGLDDSNSSGVAAGAAAADEGPEVITVSASPPLLSRRPPC